MPLTPNEAMTILRDQATWMEEIATLMKHSNSAKCAPEQRIQMIEELAVFCVELATKCAQGKRLTARNIETLSKVTTFEVFVVGELNMPAEETVADDLTSSLQTPPFAADFFLRHQPE